MSGAVAAAAAHVVERATDCLTAGVQVEDISGAVKMALLDWSKSIGVAAAVGFLIAGWLLSGAASCADGWRSPSIGTSGACSYHGGVQRGSPLWFLISIAVGFSAWGIAEANSPRKKRELEEERLRKIAAQVELEQRRISFNDHSADSQPDESTIVNAIDGAGASVGKRCSKCNSEMRAVILTESPLANALHWQCSNGSCDCVELAAQDLFPSHFLSPPMKLRRRYRPRRRKR